MLSATDAVAVLRAARLYQQGIWIADDDPSQAWVQLVSALETAANAAESQLPPPLERVRNSWPELAAVLDRVGEEAESVARVIARVIKAKAKFL